MLKKILLSAVVTSVLVGTNLIACGVGGHGFKACSAISAELSTTDKLIKAVSKVGLSAAQTKKIASGIKAYEKETAKIAQMRIFPVDSFIDDNFNEKKFIGEMSEKYIAAVAARATLFKYTFSVLTKEQRTAFKNAYAAPMIEQMIRNY